MYTQHHNNFLLLIGDERPEYEQWYYDTVNKVCGVCLIPVPNQTLLRAASPELNLSVKSLTVLPEYYIDNDKIIEASQIYTHKPAFCDGAKWLRSLIPSDLFTKQDMINYVIAVLRDYNSGDLVLTEWEKYSDQLNEHLAKYLSSLKHPCHIIQETPESIIVKLVKDKER